jgi:hypothetical protein
MKSDESLPTNAAAAVFKAWTIHSPWPWIQDESLVVDPLSWFDALTRT